MFNTEKKRINFLKLFFHVVIIVVFLYLFVGQVFLSAKKSEERYRCEVYQGEWTRYFDDGTTEKISMPGKCKAERNEKIHVETILPQAIPHGMSMCFRSNRQDFEIYIEGNLRAEYTTDEIRLFGKSSPAYFVFVDLTPMDAGKTLVLYSQTDSAYSGTYSTVYYGNEIGIWLHFFDEYKAEFISAFTMILLGIFTIIVSAFMWFFYHKKNDLEYMGWLVLLAAVWVIGNNGLRQLLFPNVVILNEITFFMIMLLPFPFLFFMDNIQEKRYHKAYFVVESIVMVDFCVCTFLQCFNIKDFADTIVYMAAVCLIAILLMVVTIVIDIKMHNIQSYFLVACGIVLVLVASVIQIVIYFQRSGSFNGTIMAIGLIGLLVLTVFNTIRDIIRLEREKQNAIMAGQSKVQFLANMSHEIRTPINAVLGMDEMILRESGDENITEYAQDIESAGRSLLSLINDILDFSKMESGKMEIVPVEYDLASVLNDCYHMIAMRAKEKNLALHIENDPSLPCRLFGDEVRIRQMITNLLTNAVKYTEKGSVTLKMSGTQQENEVRLCIAVEDTGIGITEENKKKLFQRVEESRNRNIEGTGLGLAITRQLVELMGGKIWVESVYGKGSVFYLEFPQKIVDTEKIGNFAERYHKNIENMRDYNVSFIAPEARVLLVDDVVMNLKVIKGLLKNTEIQIDTAESGSQCLSMVKKKKYHLIFLDHMMPEMDGIETFHKMQEMQDFASRDAKVIMLTANAIMGAKEEYLTEGFCDYLSKPVRANELERMVSKYLPPEMVLYKEEETTHVELKENEKEETNQTAGNFLEQLDFLDVETGLSYCAGDEEFYKEMLGDYLEGDKISQLRKLYGADDWENYRIQVHALKSTSLSIGAVELSEEAKKLEQAAKDGETGYIREHHEETIKQYEKLLEQLKQVLGSLD